MVLLANSINYDCEETYNCVNFSMRMLLSTHAQHSCKDCIYDLYKVLGTCQSKYIDIDNNTYSVKSLYQGKSDSIIFAAITKGHVSVTVIHWILL